MVYNNSGNISDISVFGINSFLVPETGTEITKTRTNAKSKSKARIICNCNDNYWWNGDNCQCSCSRNYCSCKYSCNYCSDISCNYNHNSNHNHHHGANKILEATALVDRIQSFVEYCNSKVFTSFQISSNWRRMVRLI